MAGWRYSSETQLLLPKVPLKNNFQLISQRSIHAEAVWA
ncbi:hypothetical protein MPS_5657 [Mycobacterium pseudoshottsii JCM 15466]|nr:hypothetical protein MPS_5657 [Mycobacterium pseudoshottsii JCM 15466]